MKCKHNNDPALCFETECMFQQMARIAARLEEVGRGLDAAETAMYANYREQYQRRKDVHND